MILAQSTLYAVFYLTSVFSFQALWSLEGVNVFVSFFVAALIEIRHVVSLRKTPISVSCLKFTDTFFCSELFMQASKFPTWTVIPLWGFLFLSSQYMNHINTRCLTHARVFCASAFTMFMITLVASDATCAITIFCAAVPVTTPHQPHTKYFTICIISLSSYLVLTLWNTVSYGYLFTASFGLCTPLASGIMSLHVFLLLCSAYLYLSAQHVLPFNVIQNPVLFSRFERILLNYVLIFANIFISPDRSHMLLTRMPIVLAHCNEDLTHLSRFVVHAYIRCNEHLSSTYLSTHSSANVGYEASAYLQFIVENFHNSYEHVAFVHPHQFSHHNFDLHAVLVYWLARTNVLGSTCMYEDLSSNCNGLHPMNLTHETQPGRYQLVKKYWGEITEGTNFSFPETTFITHANAMFIVKWECIQKLDLNFYTHLLRWLTLDAGKDKEKAVALEYLWPFLFACSQPPDANPRYTYHGDVPLCKE